MLPGWQRLAVLVQLVVRQTQEDATVTVRQRLAFGRDLLLEDERRPVVRKIDQRVPGPFGGLGVDPALLGMTRAGPAPAGRAGRAADPDAASAPLPRRRARAARSSRAAAPPAPRASPAPARSPSRACASRQSGCPASRRRCSRTPRPPRIAAASPRFPLIRPRTYQRSAGLAKELLRGRRVRASAERRRPGSRVVTARRRALTLVTNFGPSCTCISMATGPRPGANTVRVMRAGSARVTSTTTQPA